MLPYDILWNLKDWDNLIKILRAGKGYIFSDSLILNQELQFERQVIQEIHV